MENFLDIYNEIKNPMENKSLILKLIQEYQKSERTDMHGGGIYQSLVKLNDNNDETQISLKDKEDFLVKGYSQWIKNILKLNEKQIKELEKHGMDAKNVQEFLKKFGEVSTIDDIKKIKSQKMFDKEINGWELDDGWDHIKSRYLNVRQENRIDVKHRLYINCKNHDIWKMASIFKEKCEQYGIPFYFKVGSSTSRDDKIVIYSDTDNIFKYIDILKEIAKENPEMRNGCGLPPVLTGKIDNWIGIGDEPPKKENGKNNSYNKLRARIIEDAIEEALLEDIESFKGKVVEYNNNLIKFNELFLQSATNVIIEKLEKEGKRIEKTSKLSDFGIEKNELNSSKLKQHLKENLSKKIQKGLNKLKEVKDKKEDLMSTNLQAIFKVTTRNEKGIEVNILDMDKIIKTMIPIIQQLDISFTEKVQHKIKEKCIQSGIDLKSFCFQKETIKNMQQIEHNENRNKQVKSRENVAEISTSKFREESLLRDVDNNKGNIKRVLENTTSKRRIKMEENYNRDISKMESLLEELDAKAPKDSKELLGIESRKKLKEFETQVQKRLVDIEGTINYISNKDKNDIDINAQEMMDKLKTVERSIRNVKGKYDYSAYDNIEFTEEIENIFFSLENKIAKLDPRLAYYRINELTKMILEEQDRLQNKSKEVDLQWYFSDNALLRYEQTKNSQLGKLISNFEDILFTLDKDAIENHSRNISSVLNIQLPEEIIKEDVSDLQSFVRNRDMILRKYNELELDSKIEINQQGKHHSNIVPKEIMKKPTMEICNLCQMVKNSPNVDIESLIDRYYNSTIGSNHVQEIKDGVNLKFYINRLQELTDEITKKDAKLGKEFYNYTYSYTMEYVGLGFMKEEYKDDDFIKLYKDVCSQIKDYNENIQDESSKSLMNDIYSRYFQEYIIENSHNPELIKVAQEKDNIKNTLLNDAYKNIKKSDLDKSLQTIQNTKNERTHDQQTEYRF